MRQNKIVFALISTLILGSIFYSCKDTVTYAEKDTEEQAKLQEFLDINNITVEPDSGIYFIQEDSLKGFGDTIKDYDRVYLYMNIYSVGDTGSLAWMYSTDYYQLNPEIITPVYSSFNTSSYSYRSYTANPGLYRGITQMLSEGNAQAQIIIPSQYGLGPDNKSNSSGVTYYYGFSTLVYYLKINRVIPDTVSTHTD
ncbi:MAG: hypothetical protein ACK5IQ_11950 [Bacteroidales bacterium]